ncbi:MAG: glycerol-3-phosphate 1-O-acyltransferase PlsY [Eubacteriales bacterium]|nr:glycerol-3-phosphate 1-O-acyltransferase PlsY [Eubacteriales bacterium]
MVMMYILSGVIGYVIGCISFGYLTGKIFKGKDIRDVGSGNAGTANAIRNYGWAIGLITFAGDVAKGALAAGIGFWLCGEIGVYIGGVAAVLGHIWPVFLKFRGGKGVATSFGVFLVMMPLHALIVFAICVVIIAITRTMSVGSLIGTALMVAVSLIFYWPFIGNHIASVMLLILVYYSHRHNIKRLAEGKENQL